MQVLVHHLPAWLQPLAVAPRCSCTSSRWWGTAGSSASRSPAAPPIRSSCAVVSASDASRAFELRCDVREALMAFIRDEMPEALVRRRCNVELSTPHDLDWQSRV